MTHPPPNQKQYGHLTLVVWNGSDNIFYLNSRAEIFEDLGRQKEDVMLFTPASEIDKDLKHVTYKSSFDFCKGARNIMSNKFLLTYLGELVKKADHILSNFKVENF